MQYPSKIKILIIEDSEEDAFLLVEEVKKGGYIPVFEVVDTASAMTDALAKEEWDVIISDFKLPGFSGLEALNILRKKKLDLPFILVSGTIGEEMAVEVMKAGACDYISKEKLSRLVPVIERELREAKIREERKIAREALKISEKFYRTIFENTGTATIIFEDDMTISLANTECEKLSGYSKEEIEGKKKWIEFVFEEDLEKMKEYHILRGKDPTAVPSKYEFRLVDKENNLKNILLTVAVIPGTKKRVASLLDITNYKKALRDVEESQKNLQLILETMTSMIIVTDIDGRIMMFNRASEALTGYNREEVIGKTITEVFIPKEWIPDVKKNLANLSSIGNHSIDDHNHSEIPLITKSGQERIIEWRWSVFPKLINEKNCILATGVDITEKRKMEKELKKRIRELEDFYEMAVGRELRMIELKEQMEEMRKELERCKKNKK